MSENAQKPRIRFKGFSDAWEQRKFEDLYNYASEGGTPDTNNSFFYKNGDVPFVKIEDTESKYIDSTKSYITQEGLSHSSAWLIPENSVIFTNGATVGNVAINLLPVATKQGILGVIPSKKVVTEFLFYLLSSATFQREVRSRMATGTFATIILKNLNQIPVCIPSDKSEQEEIAGYLSAFDNLITLHQRKYDKLVAVKKALLEKMFPADGETVPKIRFNGFSDAWEQRKLWQLTIWDKKFNGVESYKQVKVIKYPYVLADVFSQIEDMSGTVRLLSTGSYIGYTTKEKAGNNLCYGEIVAIPWGGVANIKYYNGFFVTADNRIATSSNTQVLSNRYLHWWMESNITQIQSTYRGASIQHPSMNDILSLSIYLPSIEEQEQISNKLDTLDNLITLHQRQLEKLKNIKSALLEKMFV